MNLTICCICLGVSACVRSNVIWLYILSIRVLTDPNY